MQRLFLFCSLLFTVYSLLFSIPVFVRADETSDKLNQLNQQIQNYEQKLKELAGQKKTLSVTVNYLNTQIQLTQSKIAKTEQQLSDLRSDIAALSGRIDELNSSLDDISNILIRRVRETYIQSQGDPIYLFFSSSGLPEFISRYKYMRIVQNHDKEILLSMERIRANYNVQKTDKQEKQDQIATLNDSLKAQKVSLAKQQREKQQLLDATKNDERQFQNLLSKAQAELSAIQNIIAGKGVETKVGDVREGDKIASVIPSASACSSGAHLHFEVDKNGAHYNPFDFLSNKSVVWDNSDSQQTFTGSWQWPLNDPIRVTQGYGITSYSKIYANGFHTGVDIVNTSNYDVKAVKDGTLYRGSIGCGGGTLRYVKVDHGDGLETYYLHVNYI